MFIVVLRFTGKRDRASEFMEEHKAWIRRGFDDGVFLMVGSIQPDLGGSILAYNISRDALEARVNEDPFVTEGIGAIEILEISPARLDERMKFLLD